MDIAENIALSRRSVIERWLMEPVLNAPPNDITFAEIDAALDRIEARVKLCRERYPFRKPANSVEALLRHARSIAVTPETKAYLEDSADAPEAESGHLGVSEYRVIDWDGDVVATVPCPMLAELGQRFFYYFHDVRARQGLFYLSDWPEGLPQ